MALDRCPPVGTRQVSSLWGARGENASPPYAPSRNPSTPEQSEGARRAWGGYRWGRALFASQAALQLDSRGMVAHGPRRQSRGFAGGVHWSSRERGEPPPARWSRCGGRVGRSGKSAGDLVEGAADPTPLRSGGARGGQSSAVEDVGVDHGGLDVSMTEEVLDGTNVVPVFKEMGGEGMA